MTGCPSDFTLDELSILGDASDGASSVRAHIAGCPACAARMRERQALAAEFRRRRKPLPSRRPWRWWLPALAAATSVLCVVALGRAPYRGAKGMAHQIFCKRGQAVFRLGSGDDVRPGDALRFELHPARPDERHAVLGSVDGSGRYSPLYPSTTEAGSVAIPDGNAPLAGSIVLDGAPGPESVVIVTGARPFSATSVRDAVLRAGPGAPLDALTGQGLSVTWVVLPKVVP